jgi:hypothetical protein
MDELSSVKVGGQAGIIAIAKIGETSNWKCENCEERFPLCGQDNRRRGGTGGSKPNLRHQSVC